MESALLDLAIKNGIFAALFIAYLFWNEKRNIKREEVKDKQIEELMVLYKETTGVLVKLQTSMDKLVEKINEMNSYIEFCPPRHERQVEDYYEKHNQTAYTIPAKNKE